ncbi:hypothetical protein M5K25_018282 [Dendrobium thyrsiflorum]|uniref:Uncharacterized protein n=1 Tax=Dendrobium thyrsiflorum TaxID=117978 RepID=A0ABD0UHV2_DENTH
MESAAGHHGLSLAGGGERNGSDGIVLGMEGNGGNEKFGMVGSGGKANLGRAGKAGSGGSTAGCSGIDGRVGCGGNDGAVVSRRWRPP